MTSLSARFLQRLKSRRSLPLSVSQGSSLSSGGSLRRYSSEIALMEPAILHTLSVAQCQIWLRLHGVAVPQGTSGEEDFRRLVAEHAGLNYEDTNREAAGLNNRELVQRCDQCCSRERRRRVSKNEKDSSGSKALLNELPEAALSCIFEHLSGQKSGHAIIWGQSGNHRALAESGRKFLDAYYSSIRVLKIENTNAKDDEIITFLKNGGEHLRIFALHCCPFITDHLLGVLRNYCPNLESIELSSMKRILDAGVSSFAKAYGGQVKKVRLQVCGLLTNDCLQSLGECCSSIASLNLTNVSKDIGDGGVCVLLKAIGRTLTNLCIDDSGDISDTSLLTGSRYCSGLNRITLRSLPNISNRGVIALTDKAGLRLVSLCLSRCNRISDTAVAWIGNRNHNLQELDLSGLRLVGDEGLCDMSEGLGDSLKRLNISWNPRATDVTLYAIAKNNLDIVELKVSNMASVSDNGIVSLCRAAGAHLEALDISQNANISSSVFETILHHNTGLTELKISGCNRLTRRAVRKLQKYAGSRLKIDSDAS